jgi:hypothetical protein
MRKELGAGGAVCRSLARVLLEANGKVRAELDEKKYPKGVKVSDAQLAAVNLSPHSFHGDCNYTIAPRRRCN